MRIYVPCGVETTSSLGSVPAGATGALLPLPEGTAVFGVASAPAGTDPEELEYDAIQDAVWLALNEGDPVQRAVVVACDAPDSALAPADDAGAFGLVVVSATNAEIASVHVTEQSRRASLADDTDPALLWFDAAEIPDALAYARA